MIKIEKVPVTQDIKVIYCDLCTKKIGELEDYNRSVERPSPRCARIFAPDDTTSDNVKTVCEPCYNKKLIKLFFPKSAGN